MNSNEKSILNNQIHSDPATKIERKREEKTNHMKCIKHALIERHSQENVRKFEIVQRIKFIGEWIQKLQKKRIIKAHLSKFTLIFTNFVVNFPY